MTIRLANSVDVMIYGSKPGMLPETVVGVLRAHTKMSVAKAEEVAVLILSGQKVGIEFPSSEIADLMVHDARQIGLLVESMK